MNRPQSISALNEHWWYRLIKVLSFLVFLGIFLLGLLVIYSGSSDAVDFQRSVINCNNGNSSALTQLQYLIGSPSYNELENSNLGFIPDIPDPILTFLNDDFNAFCANSLPLSQAQLDALNGKPASKPIIATTTTPPPSNTKIIPLVQNFYLSIETKEFTWMRAIYALIWLGFIILFFELIRHAFYYIVLGKSFPKKI
jgi:hypothetical protein